VYSQRTTPNLPVWIHCEHHVHLVLLVLVLVDDHIAPVCATPHTVGTTTFLVSQSPTRPTTWVNSTTLSLLSTLSSRMSSVFLLFMTLLAFLNKPSEAHAISPLLQAG
jgi:hypothetical protein